MAIKLSEPIAAYFTAKNSHDVEAMLAPFAAAAVVKDEGEERHGLPAIRRWMEETTRKYRVTVAVTDVSEKSNETRVTCRVAGSFPGSPVDLHYAFTLDGGKIAHLVIGP
jgi:hypothetical protein